MAFHHWQGGCACNSSHARARNAKTGRLLPEEVTQMRYQGHNIKGIDSWRFRFLYSLLILSYVPSYLSTHVLREQATDPIYHCSSTGAQTIQADRFKPFQAPPPGSPLPNSHPTMPSNVKFSQENQSYKKPAARGA